MECALFWFPLCIVISGTHLWRDTLSTHLGRHGRAALRGSSGPTVVKISPPPENHHALQIWSTLPAYAVHITQVTEYGFVRCFVSLMSSLSVKLNKNPCRAKLLTPNYLNFVLSCLVEKTSPEIGPSRCARNTL